MPKSSARTAPFAGKQINNKHMKGRKPISQISRGWRAMTSPDIPRRGGGEEEAWDKLSQHCPGLLSLHPSPLIRRASRDVHQRQETASEGWSMESWLCNSIPACAPHTCSVQASVTGITHPPGQQLKRFRPCVASGLAACSSAGISEGTGAIPAPCFVDGRAGGFRAPLPCAGVSSGGQQHPAAARPLCVVMEASLSQQCLQKHRCSELPSPAGCGWQQRCVWDLPTLLICHHLPWCRCMVVHSHLGLRASEARP